MISKAWPTSRPIDAAWWRWVAGCLSGRWQKGPSEGIGYALEDEAALAGQCANPNIGDAFGPFSPPPEGATLGIILPGCAAGAIPDADPFIPPSDDKADLVALHAFSWADRSNAPAAMAALWPVWLARYATSDRAVAWNPPVTAARAVAILDFARHHGLPEPRRDTLTALARHVRILAGSVGSAEQTPYLHARALQGRALFRLGLDLGIPTAADLGFATLRGEAERLGRPSGMSALESLPHHLELTAAYADSWLAARRHAHAGARTLEGIARRFLGAVHALTLPGGLPSVGDVLPIVPPDWLSGLLPGADPTGGWTGRLPAEERVALLALRDTVHPSDLTALGRDGWLRQNLGPWCGLWHAAPGGWSRVGTFGHQDLGAFVLRYQGISVFTDPGGSALGAINGARECRSARHHGGLQLNDCAPYPADHADYTEAFRLETAGPAPLLQAEHDGVSLSLRGFNRLGGPREVKRHWRFEAGRMVLEDIVNGTGRFEITRRLITPLLVERTENGLALENGGKRFVLSCDAPLSFYAGDGWPGFGNHVPVRVIECRVRTNLPWRARLTVEAV